MAKIFIEQFDEKKLRGGYYTPQEITEFVCRWAIDDPGKRVLDPSCGDGNFLEASIQRFKAPGVPADRLNGLIRGIELIHREAQKATERAARFGLNLNAILNTDFFEYFGQHHKSPKCYHNNQKHRIPLRRTLLSTYTHDR